MSQYVRIEHFGAVAVLRLDRPPVNALNIAVHQQLSVAAEEIGAHSATRAVVLYGGPRAFAAGADIKEMLGPDQSSASAPGSDPVPARPPGPTLPAAIEAIAGLRVPVIAAVTGYALGGGFELALAADFRLLADNAVVGLPEVTLGVIPGAGGTQRLARLVGPAVAKELIFSGRPVPAAEALGLGLASRLVPPDTLLDAAMDWAGRLAAGPTLALAAAKQAIDRGLDGPLAAGLQLEQELFAGLFGTADQREGMSSFVARGPGKAAFVGR